MPLSAKEQQQRWRDKKKSTPEGLAEYKRAEQQRYVHRKETGSRKLVKDMTAREHRVVRKKWREWKVESIRRRETESQQELQPCDHHTHDKDVRGRRKVRKDRAKAYRTIAKLKEELQQKNKTIKKISSAAVQKERFFQIR